MTVLDKWLEESGFVKAISLNKDGLDYWFMSYSPYSLMMAKEANTVAYVSLLNADAEYSVKLFPSTIEEVCTLIKLFVADAPKVHRWSTSISEEP